MHREVANSMGRGHSWGEFAVRKVFNSLWPGAVLHPCENDAHAIPKLLDTSCGIDWLAEHQGLVKGVSVRAQKHSYAYNQTLTVRNSRQRGQNVKESELAKAIKAHEANALTAAYHLHAYVDVDDGPARDLVCWCLARRSELFRWIWENRPYLQQNHTEDVGRGQVQSFYYVRFEDIPDNALVAYSLAGAVHTDGATEDLEEWFERFYREIDL